jgi:tetratricopeptide (TPR) repeat protein
MTCRNQNQSSATVAAADPILPPLAWICTRPKHKLFRLASSAHALLAGVLLLALAPAYPVTAAAGDFARWMNLGKAELENRNSAKAIEAFSAAVQLEPRSPSALRNLARVFHPVIIAIAEKRQLAISAILCPNEYDKCPQKQIDPCEKTISCPRLRVAGHCSLVVRTNRGGANIPGPGR